MSTLYTERLLLRPWRDADKAAFRMLNADSRVMEFFPAPLNATESDALADAFGARLATLGYGFWVLEEKDSGTFLGFTGLNDVAFAAAFTPALEIGWRLRPDYWGQGYAHEAASAALAYAFHALGQREVVAFTTEANLRSRRLMERLDMEHNPADDFDHPRLDPQSPLRRHVLYRIHRPR